MEGGLIDKAHHEGHARNAIDETIALDRTIQKTVDLLQELGMLHETLLIVTGGHGHTMSINGYPNRTANILGNLSITDWDDLKITMAKLVINSVNGMTLKMIFCTTFDKLLAGIADKSKHDDIPYTTLTYATGAKINFQYNQNGHYVSRDDPEKHDTTSRQYAQQAAILTDRETHGGGDVTVYAQGGCAVYNFFM